jgi:hypothetical protein
VNDLLTGRNGADDLDGGDGASVTTAEKTQTVASDRSRERRGELEA